MQFVGGGPKYIKPVYPRWSFHEGVPQLVFQRVSGEPNRHVRRFASDDGPMALRCRANGRDLRDARLLEQIRWELMSKNWTSPLTPPAPPPPEGLTEGKIKELMRLAVNGGHLTFDGRVGTRKSSLKCPCGVAQIQVSLI